MNSELRSELISSKTLFKKKIYGIFFARLNDRDLLLKYKRLGHKKIFLVKMLLFWLFSRFDKIFIENNKQNIFSTPLFLLIMRVADFKFN